MQKTVYLIGIGPGSGRGMTREAAEAVESAELYAGADRMLRILPDSGKPRLCTYRPEEIRSFLDSTEGWTRAAVLFSGDVGFYSGAEKTEKALAGYRTVRIPGVSSVCCLCARLGIPWDSTRLISLHGRRANLVTAVRDSRWTFALLSGPADLKKAAERLLAYDMDEVRIFIGEQLGYPEEKIRSFSAGALMEEIEDPEVTFDPLLSAVFENPDPRPVSVSELPDGEMIRGSVPMTKSEVRTVSLAKLGLQNGSVLYDIGAGTGSCSMQASLWCPEGQIYAVERKREALDLIAENRYKFRADNVEIVPGEAPEALQNLPAPTHVLIGGSGGKLRRILEAVWEKNPDARIVINCVTLNSAAELYGLLQERGIRDAETVQISAARAQRAGGYELMTGQNPVLIVTIPGRPEQVLP